ncbi:MAG: hypothetical protein ACOC3C_08230, partial [Candidatus Thorarchaeota archaeon]
MESDVEEFVSQIRYLESSYQTARVRSLLLKLDGKEVPCITKIDLLTTDFLSEGKEIWPSKNMRIIEGTIPFNGIEGFLDDICSCNVSIGGVQIGYELEEEPGWRYGVGYRGERIGEWRYDTTTLYLRGTIDRRDLEQDEINELQNEIRLNPILPLPSIRKLLSKFFGLPGDKISQNLIDVIAPSNARIISLTNVGRKVTACFECPREMAESMQVKAILVSGDGGFHLFRPKLRKPRITSLSNDFVQVIKSFQIPKRFDEPKGVDLTLSL